MQPVTSTYTNLSTPHDRIVVVVHDHHYKSSKQKRIEITKLNFWHNGEIEHPVNPQLINPFLKHVNFFGASVYPEIPETPCYALDGEINPESGECYVAEMYYQGELIYTQTKSTTQN